MLEARIVRDLESLRQRRPMPVTVARWDGTQVPPGGERKVGIHLRTTRAARYLLRPSLDALGEGYVERHLDVDGRIGDIFEVAEALARDADDRKGRGRLPAWLPRHSRRTDREAIAFHYDVSNAFYAQRLDPRMPVPAPTSTTRSAISHRTRWRSSIMSAARCGSPRTTRCPTSAADGARWRFTRPRGTGPA